MDIKDQILERLKTLGASSQNPASATQVWMDENFADSDEVKNNLDEMYNCTPPMVNRSAITDASGTWVGYWPTGIVKPLVYGRDNYKTPAPPRRSDAHATITKTGNLSEETTDAAENLTAVKKEPKSDDLKIIEYIFEHPNCMGVDIKKATGAATITAAIEWYLRFGHLVKTPINGRLYTYKVVGDWPNGKALYDHKKHTVLELRKERMQAAAWPGEKNKYKAGRAVKAFEQPAKIEVQTNREFSIAYTSSGTLMLLGLEKGTIELDRKQTQELYEFLTQSVNVYSTP